MVNSRLRETVRPTSLSYLQAVLIIALVFLVMLATKLDTGTFFLGKRHYEREITSAAVQIRSIGEESTDIFNDPSPLAAISTISHFLSLPKRL